MGAGAGGFGGGGGDESQLNELVEAAARCLSAAAEATNERRGGVNPLKNPLVWPKHGGRVLGNPADTTAEKAPVFKQEGTIPTFSKAKGASGHLLAAAAAKPHGFSSLLAPLLAGHCFLQAETNGATLDDNGLTALL